METRGNAAYALEGQLLANGWKVTKIITKPSYGSGGFFSVCYHVSNGNQNAFLKALNFAAFFSMMQTNDITAVIQEQTRAYEYEKNVLNRCRNRRLSKVATIIDEGQISIPGFVISQVPYLIFEMAEGDLRSQLHNFSSSLEDSWKLRSLHNIAIGLQQLHSVKISHQDLKPSNVLVFDGGNVSKVGDLGRALCQDIQAPHDNGGSFTGDSAYAPPEVYYGFFEPDWQRRTQQIDLYMFGSLAAFYFSGVTLTALIFSKLDPRFHFQNWRGSFKEAKAYLVDAYYQAIEVLETDMSGRFTSEVLSLVKDCSHANPEMRGCHYKRHTPLSLPFETIVSKLDLLARKADLALKK
jgi:eukaryotic-like serine/threonine-protein kinase